MSVQDDVGMIALVWACANGFTDIIQLLLQQDVVNADEGTIIGKGNHLVLQFKDLQIYD